jgi:hypothetical protein
MAHARHLAASPGTADICGSVCLTCSQLVTATSFRTSVASVGQYITAASDVQQGRFCVIMAKFEVVTTSYVANLLQCIITACKLDPPDTLSHVSQIGKSLKIPSR